PGALNAITDVDGVRVGHTTMVQGEAVRTGVTAILPHAGNVFRDKVAGAVFVGNAFGKLAGSTQVRELGTIESPIVLTNTLAVGAAVEGVVAEVLAWPGNEDVRSVHALVGETGQTNFPGVLTIDGAPVGRALGRFAFSPEAADARPPSADVAGGSCMIVVATDAPLSPRDLERLAARAVFGLARTGSSYASGSGDYAIAFSTAAAARTAHGEASPVPRALLPSEAVSPLFQAALEAT